MTIEELISFLKEKPSYLKETISNICTRTNSSDSDVRAAMALVRKYMKDVGMSKLQEALDNNGLKLHDIKQVKIYGNVENPQISLHTKPEWYNKSEQDLIDSWKEELKKEYIPEPYVSKEYSSDTLAVIAANDLHLDKLTLVSESGVYSDVDTNIRKALSGFQRILKAACTHNPSKIIIIVGSDAFNADNPQGTTVKGTPQAVNYGWHEHFQKIYSFYRNCIDLALLECDVHIVVVEGNHDASKCFYLGQLLEVTYEKDERVTIDNTRLPRKYFKWGSTLLGFAHGDIEKKHVSDLPMIMFLENKHFMNEIDYSEFLLGDIHHIDYKQLPKAKDYKGCCIRFLRATSELGKWEYAEGYVGIPKSMDTFVYSKIEGLKANLQIHL